MQVRLSIDSDFSYENQDIDSGLSLSYDKVLVKKGNVNFGLGLEHMLPRDIDDSTFKSNNLYLFIRNIYAKKWRSYLRLGYNRISGINSNDRNGALCAFGVDYKFIPIRKGEAYETLANIDKANQLLNWKPTIFLKDWLRRVI